MPIEEALARCRDEGAGWLVVNPISRRRVDEFGAHREPRNNRELTARFHPIPGWLDSVAVVGDFQIYRIGAGSSEVIEDKTPVIASPGTPSDEAVRLLLGGVELAVESLSADVRVRRGEWLTLPACWRLVESFDGPGVASYREFEAHVRFEREDIHRAGIPGPFSKLYRRLAVEPRQGGSLRARGVELPFRGLCSPGEWPKGEWQQDTVQVMVPHQITLGRYRLKLSLDEVGLYPVLTLADLFSDEDSHEGPEIGWMIVE